MSGTPLEHLLSAGRLFTVLLYVMFAACLVATDSSQCGRLNEGNLGYVERC